MKLPGNQFIPSAGDEMRQFVDDTCTAAWGRGVKCRHEEYCTILTHAGMYGTAAEWRIVDEVKLCIRHEAETP